METWPSSLSLRFRRGARQRTRGPRSVPRRIGPPFLTEDLTLPKPFHGRDLNSSGHRGCGRTSVRPYDDWSSER